MLEAGFLAMLFLPPRAGGTAPFLGLFLATFACYLAFLRLALPAARAPVPGGPAPAPGRTVAAVLAFAGLFRATLLLGAPALSQDIERYLWDGRVVVSGGNPYSEPPIAPSLAGLRDERFERLDHTRVATIYPPAAQILFAAAAVSGWGVLGLKALLVVADLLGIAVLRRILERRRLPPQRIVVYAWNPLAVIEVAWSGHLEPAGLLCVLVAAAAIIQKRDLRSILALTLAGLVKLLPFVLFAPFLRSIRLRWLGLATLLVVAAYWPFRSAGRDLLGGVGEYARHFFANESLFGIVHAGIAWIGPTPALKSAVALLRARIPWSEPLDSLYPYLYPRDLSRGLCVVVVVLIAIGLVRRGIDPLRGAYLLTGSILLLSPILHPWYLLWILPWVCLFPSRAWILLTGLSALSYANLGAPGREAEPYPWVRWIEYLPFYALLLGDWIGARLRTSRPARAFDRPAAE